MKLSTHNSVLSIAVFCKRCAATTIGYYRGKVVGNGLVPTQKVGARMTEYHMTYGWIRGWQTSESEEHGTIDEA